MTKFKVQFSDEYYSPGAEINTKPSATVPDQTMSIREIMRRFASGLPISGEKVPMYDEENDLPDPRSLDLIDRQEWLEETRNDVAEMQQKLTKKQQKAADYKAKDKDDLVGFDDQSTNKP